MKQGYVVSKTTDECVKAGERYPISVICGNIVYFEVNGNRIGIDMDDEDFQIVI